MRQMAGQGLGIAQLPCAPGDSEPALLRVPARFVEPGRGLWVLSHVDLRTTMRVRIFRDFLVEGLEQRKDLIEGRDAGINCVLAPLIYPAGAIWTKKF